VISIGLPVYKPYFLKQAIQSVLEQSFSDFELIIINDDSPYEIDNIVEEFNDSRIKYSKNSVNLGKENLIKVWNQCLDRAKGDLFVLFSDDDLYDPHFLKELHQLSIKYLKANLFHCRVSQIDEFNNTIQTAPTCPEYELGFNFIWHRTCGYRLQFVPDFMCRTQKLRKIGGFYNLPLAWGSDDITWFRLAQIGGVGYSAKILCKWRKSRYNISTIGLVNERIIALNLYEKWLLTYIETVKLIDNIDIELIKEFKKVIPIQFTKKREYLLNQFMQNNGFIRFLFKYQLLKKVDNITDKFIWRTFIKNILRRFK